MKNSILRLSAILFLFAAFILTACNNSNTPQATPSPSDSSDSGQPAVTTESNTSGYPAPGSEAAYPGGTAAEVADYPGAAGEEIFAEPPNPERELPAAQGNNGVVGGVLIREVTAEGFIPFDPYQLILAEIATNAEGQPAFITYNDQSKRAETFPTGVFVFQEVPPGTYALVVNMAVAEFPVEDEAGNQMMITVEPGQALDLGQVIVKMP